MRRPSAQLEEIEQLRAARASCWCGPAHCRCTMALMAVDLPAFERPANATSRPTSAGNCPGAAALSMKSGVVGIGSRRLVYNPAPSNLRCPSERRPMSKTMRVAWLGCALFGAALANSSPLDRRLRAGGQRQGGGLPRLPRPQRQQHQPRVAFARGPERRVHRRAAAPVPRQRAHQSGDAADGGDAFATQDINDLAVVLLHADADRPRSGSVLLESGRAALSRRRSRPEHSGVRRLPRPGGRRQPGRRLSGAARPACGVHGEAAQRVRDRRRAIRRRRMQPQRAATVRSWPRSRSDSRPRTCANLASYIQGMR